MVARSNPDGSEHRDAPLDTSVCPWRLSILLRAYQTDGPVTVRDLLESLVDGETSGGPDFGDSTPAEFDRKELRLHHCDLPLLDDAGLLRYDPQARVVYPITESRRR